MIIASTCRDVLQIVAGCETACYAIRALCHFFAVEEEMGNDEKNLMRGH